jgi:Leucine-rich repeat (LRR) protein
LTGLHLDRQRLDKPFEWDFLTLEELGATLKKLTLSNSSVKDIEPLSLLFEMEELHLDQNHLEKIQDLEHILTFCTKLAHLNIMNNSVSSNIRMRQCLILSASDALGNLFLRLDVTCH